MINYDQDGVPNPAETASGASEFNFYESPDSAGDEKYSDSDDSAVTIFIAV